MNSRPAGVARRLIVLGAAAGVAVGVWPADRPRRIGYLSFFPRPSPGVVPIFDAFFAGMREQGYEEGRDYVMDLTCPWIFGPIIPGRRLGCGRGDAAA